MPGIEFETIITDEGIDYARKVKDNISAGWYLTPKRFEVSAIAGEFNASRTINSRKETWISYPFSAVSPMDSNKLLHDITIPANARNSSIEIKEIYFIYENHDDESSSEFLFAIARPKTDLIFIPGVSQSFKFVFVLNNVEVESIVNIEYTWPHEIDAHNKQVDAHDNLLARDGSRTATNILSYEQEMNFESDRHIIDKGYVDNITDELRNRLDNLKIEDCHYYCFKSGPVNSSGTCAAAYIQGVGTVEKYYNDFYHNSTSAITLSDLTGGGTETFWRNFLDGQQVSFPNGVTYSVVLNFPNPIKFSQFSLNLLYAYQGYQALGEFHVYAYDSNNSWIELGYFSGRSGKTELQTITSSQLFYTNKIKLVAKESADGIGYSGRCQNFKFNATEQESVSTATKLYFNVNEEQPLHGVLANGEEFVRHSVTEVNCSSLSNGTYNIFIDKQGLPILYKNTVYIQKTQPVMLKNDVWVDTSVLPFVSYIYKNNTLQNFQPVQLPQTLTVTNGVIANVKSLERGYGNIINTRSMLPDYSNAINYTCNEDVHVAPDNGWVMACIATQGNNHRLLINNIAVGWSYFSTWFNPIICFCPVSKGDNFKLSDYENVATYSQYNIYMFIPVKED